MNKLLRISVPVLFSVLAFGTFTSFAHAAKKEGTRVQVSDATGTYGGTVTLSATLTRTNPQHPDPVSGETIQFSVHGSSVGSSVTNSSGVATLSDVSIAGIDVGSYTYYINASFAGDSTYSGDTDFGKLTVTKANSTTTISCPISETYTGSAITPCTVSVTGDGGLSLTPTPTYSNNTNVGTASANYTYAGNANYNGSSNSKTFVINKAIPTIVVTPYSVIYNGNPHTVTGSAKGVKNETLAGLVVSGTTHTSAGDYPSDAWTFTDATGNYNNTSGTVHDSIAKANSNVTTWPTASDITYGQTLADSILTGGDATPAGTFAFTTPTTAPNVGTASQNVTYTPTDTTDYNSASGSVSVTVDKADSTTVVTCPDSETYTGSAITPCTAKVTGAGELDTTTSVDYTDNTNVGTAHASATFAGDDNHNGSSDTTKTFDINPVTLTANVTASSKPYDGTDTATITKCSLTGVIGSDEVSCATSGATFSDKNVWTGKTVTATDITLSGAQSGNYTVNDTATTNADITPINLTVSATATNKSFDNTTNVNSGEVILSTDALAWGTVDANFTSAAFDGSDVGPHIITISGISISGSDANNYTLTNTTATASASITQQTTTVTFDGDDNFSQTYTGSPATPITVTADPSVATSVTYDGKTVVPTDAGTYSVVGYVTDPNYSGQTDPQTLTIEKADSTTVVSCPTSETYTGSALTPCTVAVTGVGSLNLTPDSVYTNNTDVGTVSADYTFSGDDNHNGSSDSKTFDITKANQIITFGTLSNKLTTDAPFALTASADSSLPVTLNVVSGPATWDGTNLLTLTGATGLVKIEASQTGNGNYNAATSVDQSFNVNLPSATISSPTIASINPTSGSTAGGDSVTITGTEFADGATVTIGDNPATDVSVVNDTSITATTPAGTAGAAGVVVKNSDGGTALLVGGGEIGFSYVAPTSNVPLITSVSGPFSLGATPTVSGQYFTGLTSASLTSVTDSSKTYSVEWLPTSDTQIGIAMPDSPPIPVGQYNIYLTNSAGKSDGFGVTVSAPSSDVTLSNLTVNGTTVTGFDPSILTYNVTLPAGTTNVPVVIATPTDSSSIAVVTPAVSLPGATTALVTAQAPNPNVSQTYTINFTVAAPVNTGGGGGGGSSSGSGGGGGSIVSGIGGPNPLPGSNSGSGSIGGGSPGGTGGPGGGQVLGAAAYNFTVNLTVGSQGPDVTALQQFLKDEGFYSGPITGYFGPLTKAAVIAFQKANNIVPASGYVGPLTRAILNKGEIPTTPENSSGLTAAQISAIISTLQSFGVDQATLAKVEAALGQ